jgi:hypothetical protein
MGPIADYGDPLRIDPKVLTKVLRELRVNRNDAVSSTQYEPFDNPRDGCRESAALLGLSQSKCVYVLHPNHKTWPPWG